MATPVPCGDIYPITGTAVEGRLLAMPGRDVLDSGGGDVGAGVRDLPEWNLLDGDRADVEHDVRKVPSGHGGTLPRAFDPVLSVRPWLLCC